VGDGDLGPVTLGTIWKDGNSAGAERRDRSRMERNPGFRPREAKCWMGHPAAWTRL